MKEIALVVGILAVVFYAFSYQQKQRNNIIIFNAIARVLFIVQYLLLSAFEGAVLDVAGLLSSVLAGQKDKPFIAKHKTAIMIIVNLLIVGAGLLVYKDVFSLLPIIGVLLHTFAFWITDEKIIRRVSFVGSPFWLVYNIVSGAYGSCIGDILSMVSIGTAIVRYDIKKKN